MSHTTHRSSPRVAKARDISKLHNTKRREIGADLRRARRKYRHAVNDGMRRVATLPCFCDPTGPLESAPPQGCPRCDADLAFDYPLTEHAWAVGDRRSYLNTRALRSWCDAWAGDLGAADAYLLLVLTEAIGDGF